MAKQISDDGFKINANLNMIVDIKNQKINFVKKFEDFGF